jgi:hypothetical protein
VNQTQTTTQIRGTSIDSTKTPTSSLVTQPPMKITTPSSFTQTIDGTTKQQTRSPTTTLSKEASNPPTSFLSITTISNESANPPTSSLVTQPPMKITTPCSFTPTIDETTKQETTSPTTTISKESSYQTTSFLIPQYQKNMLIHQLVPW